MEQSLIDTEDSGIYQNLNDTCQVRDVNDILGPLPQVPFGCTDGSDRSWSKRVSSFSGIYEEIIEPGSRFVTTESILCIVCESKLLILEQETVEVQRFMKK